MTMNDRQSNKFKAFLNTDRFWDRLAARMTLKGRIQELRQSFKALLGAIEIKDGTRLTGTTSYTALKDEARAKLIATLKHMTSAFSLISSIKNDAELTSLAKFNIGRLANMRMTEFDNSVRGIKDMAIRYKSDLINEGVEEEDFSDLETEIAQYDLAAKNLAESESSKIAATSTLLELFRRGDAIINEFDKVITILSRKNPEIVPEYEASKTIKNLGGKHAVPPSEEDEEETTVPPAVSVPPAG